MTPRDRWKAESSRRRLWKHESRFTWRTIELRRLYTALAAVAARTHEMIWRPPPYVWRGEGPNTGRNRMALHLRLCTEGRGTTMKKVGIAVDTWKLDIFARHLVQSGYRYEKSDFTEDTMMLYVWTPNVEALEVVIRAANEEAARTKEKK